MNLSPVLLCELDWQNLRFKDYHWPYEDEYDKIQQEYNKITIKYQRLFDEKCCNFVGHLVSRAEPNTILKNIQLLDKKT